MRWEGKGEVGGEGVDGLCPRGHRGGRGRVRWGGKGEMGGEGVYGHGRDAEKRAECRMVITRGERREGNALELSTGFGDCF